MGLQILRKCISNTFRLQRTCCPSLINTISPHEYYGLVIKHTKSHNSIWCIKVGNKSQGCLFGGSYHFFVTRHDRVNRSCAVQNFLFYILALPVSNPGEEKKNKLNVYFHTSLWCLKKFYEGLKGLKPYGAPYRSVKIKI